MKTIQVNLQFGADTRAAKAQIKSLQQELNNAINAGTTGKLRVTSQIQEATRSAMDLKIALNNATNIDTGKLNLTKFQSELNRSGKNIQQYAQQLKMLGPSGVKAFNQMAQAVAQADTRLFRLSGSLKKLTGTFFNTLRWSITSSAIQGVTSAISQTVAYAKELDTSLNNIRIVTGKSAEEMARFAKEANKMAKELATTTTKYTDATLIYYQQGLSSKEVAERTKTTVKLANVVGESAQTVSEWMTAIWNNFDNGSKSLEYYADVLASLGAATASSADEIAGGLEKFAAVADTIGLSYEYAASMLATITAETRQSEDVVGTALKTILSRMEQLNQGKVLDDGTSLGKYSLALQKVGVDIKTASGELKDMDLILAETGKKWDTLARDQQIALAQSVAGIRQYTQFMALMDNWDVMEKNLAITKNANGALQEQQEIYEDSIEAAENRMKTAGEKIKSTLLNEKDLKGLYNFAEGALNTVAELLEAFGGLPTILLAVAAALTKIYQPQVASFFSQMAVAGKGMVTALSHPIQTIKGETQTQNKKFQADVFEEARKMSGTTGNAPGETGINSKMAEIHTRMVENSQEMTAAAKQRAHWEIETLEAMREEVILMSESAEQATSNAHRKRLVMEESLSESHGSGTAEKFNQVSDQAAAAGRLSARMDMMSTIASNNQDMNLDAKGKSELGMALNKQMQGAQSAADAMGLDLSSIEAELDGSMISFGELQSAITNFAEKGEGDITRLIEMIKKLNQAIQEASDKTLGTGIDTVMAEAGEASPADIENLKQKEVAQQQNIDTINNAHLQETGAGLNAEDTQKALDGLNTEAMGKGGKGQVTKWKNELKEIKKLGKGTAEYDKKLASLNKRINQSTKESTKHTGVLKRELKQTNASRKAAEKKTDGLKDLRAATEGQIQDTKNAASAQESAAIAMESVENQADKLNNKLKNNGFRHWSDTLASGVGAMASYTMGLSMMQSAFENLFTSISQGDLKIGDFISSLASVLMSVSMVIPAIMAMTKAYKDSANAKLEASIAAEKEIWASKMGITVDELEILMQKKKRGEIDKNLAKDKQEQLSNAMTAISGVAEQTGQGPKGWVTAAISLAMILPMLAMIGVGIGSGISVTNQSAAEAAAEEEETLKGQADDKKQEIDDFKSAISDYKEAQANIDKLTVGTQEWTEALVEANAEIVDLISKYSELAQFVETNANGRMTIRDEGWTYISDQLAKQAAMASTMAQAASFRTERENYNKKVDNFYKDMAMSAFRNNAKFEHTLKPLGLAAYSYGTDVGKDLASQLNFNNSYLVEYMKKGEEAFIGLEQELENLGEDSEKAAERIKTLCREYKNLQTQEELLMKTRMNNILTSELGFNSNILTPGMQDWMTKAGQAALDNADQDFSKEAGKKISANWVPWVAGVIGGIVGPAMAIGAMGAGVGTAIGLGAAGAVGGVGGGSAAYAANQKNPYGNAYANDLGIGVFATERGKDAFENYANAMGIEVEEGSVNFKNKNITYKTKDGDNDETFKVSYETILEYEKQAFLEARAFQFEQLAYEIHDTSNELLQSEKASDQAIGEYLKSGDVQALDVESFRKLKAMSGQEGGISKALTESAEGIAFLEQIGLSADEIAKDIETQINNLSENQVIANILQREQRAYEDTLSSGASALEMKNTDVLEAYAELLTKTKDGLEKNKQATAEVAVEHFKMAKGVVELRKVLDENIDTLKTSSKNSLEYAEAIGSIKTAIDKMFGTDVSFDFIETNLTEIQQMLDGSVEDYNKVRRALVKDWIKNLTLDESSIKQISSLFDDIMSRVDDGATEITIDANNTAAIQKINELVQKGQIAEKELEAAFRNANLEWAADSTFRYYELPQGTTTQSTIRGDYNGTPFEMSMETYNESTTRLPWIGDNPPKFKTFSTTDKAKAAADVQYNQGGSLSYVDQTTGVEKVFATREEFLADYEANGLGRVYKVTGTGTISEKDLKLNSKPTYIDSNVLNYNGEGKDREKERRELETEKERSYETKALIQDLSNEYDRLGKAKEQAYGAKKLTLIKQEKKNIEEQIAAQKQLIQETQNYLDIDRSALSKYNIKFDAEGRISNFSALEEDYIKRLNNINLSDSKQYEKLKEEYEEFKKAVDQYDSTRQELFDQELELVDLEIKEVENRLEEIDTEIELQVKISDASMRAIEYQLSRIEDKEYEVGAKIALRTQSFDDYKRNFEANQQGLTDILSAHDISMEDFINGDYDPSVLTQAELDKMEEIQGEMISNAQEMEDITAQLHEDYLTTFDYYNQKAEDAISTLDSYMGIIDSYRNILELTGTSMLGLTDEVFSNLYQITQANLDSQLSVTKSNLDFAKSVLADSETQLTAAQANLELLKSSGASAEEIKLAEDNVKLWEKNVSDAQARVSEQAQSYVDIVSNKIEKRIEEHQRLVDKSFEEFYKATTGYSSLDEMQEAYERQKKMSELYVDDYKKVYELSKLTRDINKSLDDTKLLKGKQALLKLEEQINAYQRDGVKMSQYQVENLRRQYELELAKIQLEEAQNAKTQVTLRQDSEGNWGYVYTANQDDIAAAEQNYEDKLYAIMEANDAYVEQTNANMIEAFSWLEDTIRAIDEDVTLSEEERQRKIAEAQNDFLEMQRFYSSEIDMVVSYNNLLYDSEARAFEGAMSDMEISGEAFIDWNEDVFADSINTLTGNINDDYKKMSEDCQAWVSGLHDATGLAINGGDGKEGMISMFGNLADKIAAVQSEGTDKLSKAAEDISNFTSTTNEKLAPLLERLGEINDAFALMYQNQQDLANAKMLKGTTRTGHYEVDKTLTETDLANIKTYNSLGEVNTGYTGSSAFDPGQKVYGYTTYTTPDGRVLYGVHTDENGSQVYISQDDFNEHFGSGWSSTDAGDTPGGDVVPGGDVPSEGGGNGSTPPSGWFKYNDPKLHLPNQGHTLVGDKVTYDGATYAVTGIKVNSDGTYYSFTESSSPYDPYPDSKYKKGMKINSWENSVLNAAETKDGKATKDVYAEQSFYKQTYGGVTYTSPNTSKDYLPVGSEILEVAKVGEEYRYRFTTGYGNTVWISGLQLERHTQTFDTGGYTGSWGPEGRMAMLHQKEIVLNAHDTENFLTAINIVRSMADQLDINARLMQQGLLHNLSAVLPSMNRDTLEQNVTIHAEFPNATNHSEIEEAFGNLVNLAAQYANNKY